MSYLHKSSTFIAQSNTQFQVESKPPVCPSNCTSKRPHVHAASIGTIASATSVGSYGSATSSASTAFTASTTTPLKADRDDKNAFHPAQQSDFYRQTRFEFEDRVRSPDLEHASPTWGGFDFGFGSAGVVRASVYRKKEEEERKQSWFEWVSMHLL